MKVRRALGIVGTAAVARCTGGATGVNAPTEQPASDSGTTFADANRTSDVAPPSRPKNDATNEFTPPLRAQQGVFVHLFEWTWRDVAAECESFLGPKGFAAVQVSPPSEHAVLSGNPWWERYQTVGYTLDRSRSGTRAEFVDMVQRCARAGVGIYVDAVINHMTGQASGVGSNGTQFTKYSYPGLYAPADFHTPTCTIMPADYASSAENVQNCELVGLADLDTGDESVRRKIADYLILLVQIGVRGFRFDAAKHMAPADLDAIVGKVNAAVLPVVPYYFFEIIDYGGEAVHREDYLAVGQSAHAFLDITEFKYGSVGDYFLNRMATKLAGLSGLNEPAWGLLPSARAVVFTNNHDTQRATAIYYKDAPYLDLANAFMLAFPYGHPSVMSSFAFDRATQAGRDSGPLSDAAGHTTAVYAAGMPRCSSAPGSAEPGEWVCEHRARAVANMVAFRRVAGESPVVNFWDNGANQIAFGRGAMGFVVINREDAPLVRAFQTGLAKGKYCDVIGGDFLAGACGGVTVEVDTMGIANVAVPRNTVVALHVEAKLAE
jgi:alpha-amylase